MKEIKMRIWDPLAEQMLEWKDIKDLRMIESDTYDKLLYTGLKDRNEKEIYESDLTIIHGDKCLIEYDLKSASFIARSTSQDSYWALDEDTFKLGVKVIGNIYKNPELVR